MTDRRLWPRLASALSAALIVAPAGIPIASRAANEVTETRAVSGFDHIRVQGVFSTEVTASAHRTHVVLTGDPNLLARVTTEVQDGWLVVGMRPGVNFGPGPKLQIALPHLRAFENNGAGSATINGLNGGDVEITNSGAASIVAYGHAARETVSLNGTGKIDTTAVNAHDVTVDNNGVGAIHVRANGDLQMNVNGVGEIRYTGNPTHVESHINGIGRINRL